VIGSGVGGYRRMISITHPGLIFAGLVQPVGPTIPLVEIQGRWLAAVLSGDIDLRTSTRNGSRSPVIENGSEKPISIRTATRSRSTPESIPVN
jgi:hypothetical protein